MVVEDGLPEQEEVGPLNMWQLRIELVSEKDLSFSCHTMTSCTEPTQLPCCSLYRKRKSGWRRVADPTSLVCDKIFPLTDPSQKATPLGESVS